MADWTLDGAITTFNGGRFRIVVTRLGRGGRSVNVTTWRRKPTVLSSYSSADPFGDSAAVLQFPTITPLDDLASPPLAQWLAFYSNVDIYWVPVIQDPTHYPHAPRVIDPNTNQPGPVVPTYLRGPGVKPGALNAIKIWEGYIASLDFTDSDSGAQLEVQCQGAIFQLDRYNQKPFFPARPWPLEKLIADAFSHDRKPHLRTRPLQIRWPDRWSKKIPKYTGSATIYTPVGRPGENFTGYTSRSTGSWEHALTGFVQDTLLDMIVDKKSGVTPGNQWTITHQRHDDTHPGRTPVLEIRDRFRNPDFTVRAGTPGLTFQLTGDSTQSEDVIYGEGTDINGQVWRNAVISSDGSRTDYAPLAADVAVWPSPKAGSRHNRQQFVTESYVKFAPGFSQVDAVTVAEQQLARDHDPGWSGTITLATDPSAALPRWLIRAGMAMKVKGLFGSGEQGIVFHIASVQTNPQDGTVALTVDTRFRDLLTVAEALQRTRDPLTPTRMLQVGKNSVLVEDIQAPWDYSAGSGFIPRESVPLYQNKPSGVIFPYGEWIKKHPPATHRHWYVGVNAAAPKPDGRWTRRAVPILTSEKGSIARSEFFVCDVNGNLLKIPFHVSIYYTRVTFRAMPHVGVGQHDPFLDNAFEKIDPQTGQEWAPEYHLAPDQYLIIGWGNQASGILNRAGFSPGSEAEGGKPTGLLFDDTVWTFDNTSTDNTEYNRNARIGDRTKGASLPGHREKDSAVSLYAMFYAEYTEPVYFGGRLYRQNQGV